MPNEEPMPLAWQGLHDRLIERVPIGPTNSEVVIDGYTGDDLAEPLLVVVHPDVVARVDMDMRAPAHAQRCAKALAGEIETWNGDVAILLSDNIDGIADMDCYPGLKRAIDTAAENGAHVWLTPETETALKYAGIDLVERYSAHKRPEVAFTGGFADAVGGCLAHVAYAYETAGGCNHRISDAAVVAHGRKYVPAHEVTDDNAATPVPG